VVCQRQERGNEAPNRRGQGGFGTHTWSVGTNAGTHSAAPTVGTHARTHGTHAGTHAGTDGTHGRGSFEGREILSFGVGSGVGSVGARVGAGGTHTSEGL
jgi:hypothetical protein